MASLKNRETNPYYGATVGRVAGRIGGGKFLIKGDLIPEEKKEEEKNDGGDKKESEEKKVEELKEPARFPD